VATQSIFTTNRSALATGASAGIGLELAKALAPKLNSLIVVARRVERLEQVARELRSRFPTLNVAIQVADLSDPEAVEGLLQQLEASRLEVDMLVNNAGLGESELFETSP
jgi:short-subunit dehydrogenase